MRENTVLMVMDFARNRWVYYQDEIKAAYFSQRQIIMHPIVCYYKQDNGLLREALVFLSDDVGHDYHAVNHYHAGIKINFLCILLFYEFPQFFPSFSSYQNSPV